MIKLDLAKQGIFFCSDPHYGHANIVRGTSTWENKERCKNFDTLEEHNQALVDNINKHVGKNDVLFCLGDWSFGGPDKVGEFREQLNVETIHLVLGNHDVAIRNSEERQKNFTSVQDYLEVRVSVPSYQYGVKSHKQLMVLSHYAFRVWNNSHRGSISLHGHSHGTLDNFIPRFPEPTWIGDNFYIKNSMSMDVGFDCNPRFEPFSYGDIDSIMRTKQVLLNTDTHEQYGEI